MSRLRPCRPALPRALRAFILLLALALVALPYSLPAVAQDAAPAGGRGIVGLLRTDLQGHGSILLLIDPADGRILDFNAAAVHFYGYPPETLARMHIQDINMLGPAEVAAEREKARAESRSYFIFPHKLADGSVRTVEVYSSPVALEGGRIALFSIIHDITGKRVAEEELLTYKDQLEATVVRRTEEAMAARAWLQALLSAGLLLTLALNLLLVVAVRRKRDALRALEAEAARRAEAQAALAQAHGELQRFAEITAHHLQEPARRMAVFAQRLESRAGQHLRDPGDRQALAFIDQQARRLQALLRDVQLYLAATQPRGPMHTARPDLVIASCLAALQATTGRLLTVAPLPVLPPLRIDEARLRDVVTVILDNMVLHAVDGDGTAPTAPLVAEISATTRPGWVTLRFADHGPGIPPTFRDRVFGVFERLSAGGDHTGIGLAITRRIVQACGGNVYIEETPGGGCTVVLDLPAGDASEATDGTGIRPPRAELTLKRENRR